MRIAACADVHARVGDDERIRDLFRDVRHRADVLVIAGDLTDHGRPAEAETLLRGLDDVGVPVITVLGNHDHENGVPEDLARMLRSGGVCCLEGTEHTTVIGDVGFAGVKGFGGGFGDRIVRGFGETATKAFVTESVLESEALRAALLRLETRRKVAVTHYSPIEETVRGEPPEIHVFLGTTRLAEAIDAGGAGLAIHGHAHHGSLQGKTPRGVKVWNASIPVLRSSGQKESYVVLEA